LATRYGTSVDALIAANGLKSSHRIYVGQRLQIPTGSTGEAQRHVVRPGETLAAIARLYSSTVAAIQRANSLSSHLIYPRQVLIIP
jgi:LysM repeat protein